ncbi:MAG: relaxase [Methylocystaceae bacterium]|nr:relaxase [Methylocystaceae bacterium]
MILVGNQRGGARDLARHLMKQENERVEVHELRGFVAGDLDGAFQESYAISRGTRCKQFLFSLSLNPPKGADVSNDQFIRAIDLAEGKLDLNGQPRAIVFHEKRGDDGEVRRHAHVVWSRINVEEMKAVALPHSKRKMQDVSRELYLEHGWKMPKGLAVSGASDPRNFTLAEWQQAKRTGQDPRAIKTRFQDAWAISDNKASFQQALQERGFWLCRGDKRGYVALDVHGEVHNIAKRVGIKTKEVKARLGDKDALPSVAETKIEIARTMHPKMQEFRQSLKDQSQKEEEQARQKQSTLQVKQKAQREAFKKAVQLRGQAEERERQNRFRGGLLGLWDKIRGAHKRTVEQNAKEVEVSQRRDNQERSQLSAQHLSQRKKLVKEHVEQREENKAQSRSLSEDAKVFKNMEIGATKDLDAEKEAFKERRRSSLRPRRRSRSRDGPKIER